MSGLAEASAIIGISNITITGINTLYQYLKDLKNAPEVLKTLEKELSLLELNLHGLESLKEADQKIQDEIMQTGLFQTLDECNKYCAQLRADFDTWAKRGADSWRGKLEAHRQLRHITKVQGTVAVVRNTARALQCAVSVLSLRLHLSQRISLSDSEPNLQQIELWRSEVEIARDTAETRAHSIEQEAEDDNVDAEVTISELKKQASASGDFLALYDKLIPRLQSIQQLKQQIGDTTTEKEGEAQVGMAKEAVPFVQSQTIGSTYTGEKAKSSIGIF